MKYGRPPQVLPASHTRRSQVSDEEPTEGRRVGVHPLIVVFGVIFGLWLFITLIIPKSKTNKIPGTEGTSINQGSGPAVLSSEVVPTFEATGVVAGINAITLLVPLTTTDSQVIALLHYLKKHRVAGNLGTILPATTPEDKLGEFAIADIYIFSEERYAVGDAAKALGRGAHAPGEFYPSSITYEEAMEHVRGHYSIDLYNRNQPEQASIGYGEDATGVYSKRYQRIF